MNRFFNSLFLKILAAFLIFIGFGMIHGNSQLVERLGSIFIGVGSFYFILLLYRLQRKKQN